MRKIELENLLPTLFKYDLNKNGKYTLISQLSIITIKSLLPSEYEMGTRINYKRYYEELKLLRSYSVDIDKLIENTIFVQNKYEYFNVTDKNFLSRILPIIVSNKKWEIIEEEIVKNTLFFTGKAKNILNNLISGYYIYLYINETHEKIIKKIKDYTVNLNQLEFFEKYKRYFQVKEIEYPKNYKIEFEKQKIKIINILNGIYEKEYIIFIELLNLLDNEIYDIELDKTNEIADNILKINIEKDIYKFYKDMSEYALKLRKSKINPEKLKINKYILPDIFEFEEGDNFYHSLLNNSKVIKKIKLDSEEVLVVQTKTGRYVFRKRPNLK